MVSNDAEDITLKIGLRCGPGPEHIDNLRA